VSKINATPATDSAGELEEAAASEGLLDNADGGEDGASEDEGDEDLIGTASATGHAMSDPYANLDGAFGSYMSPEPSNTQGVRRPAEDDDLLF